MSFLIVKATPSADVATSGTITFGYPLQPAVNNPSYPYPFDLTHVNANPPPAIGAQQTSIGDFFSSNSHVAYAAGTQNKMIFGKDFSLTFNTPIASGITFTNLSASTIPAGTQVSLQLEFVGQNDGRPFGGDARIGRGAMAPVAMIRLGAPLALAAGTVVSAVASTLTTVITLATPVTLDVPRGLSIVSSNAGDTTQTVTARGTDEFGAALTETIAANGTTTVNGKKAFKTVISYQVSASMAGNLSIGQSNVLGIPIALENAAYVIMQSLNGAAATAGTLVAEVNTAPSATTGDVRGTVIPNSACDGVKTYELGILAPDPTYRGLTQYAG